MSQILSLALTGSTHLSFHWTSAPSSLLFSVITSCRRALHRRGQHIYPASSYSRCYHSCRGEEPCVDREHRRLVFLLCYRCLHVSPGEALRRWRKHIYPLTGREETCFSYSRHYHVSSRCFAVDGDAHLSPRLQVLMEEPCIDGDGTRSHVRAIFSCLGEGRCIDRIRAMRPAL